MAAFDNLHSRVVAWLKVLLPLMALALLSSLFLVARTGDNSDSLPFSEQDLEQMASEQRVDGPEFSGVTEDGKAITLNARSATPRDAKASVVDAVEVSGTMETGDNSSIRLTSDAGTVHATESRTVLRGNVHISTSTGYQVDTDELSAALDRTDMETTGPVSGTGPIGSIDAGRMVVTQSGEDRDSVTVVFKDGVRLLYVPGNQ
ncbi:LPS export ABC transporter periplasmic protein LptC [Tropicimonas sediminicola]|uniref:Lipopolysaccharide export system protein LptC n=1 Tax=Tropicimonas sediminicola TaxID=1031541 RepID=A0A239L5F4_9RHOB|nr:LPS export ABC transporter periplasmic protein LptC [Tropicimonas sediminicola]SNT24774.1 lipopolysaccharide export system protein LptC [Tropicimonas sediminicola]